MQRQLPWYADDGCMTYSSTSCCPVPLTLKPWQYRTVTLFDMRLLADVVDLGVIVPVALLHLHDDAAGVAAEQGDHRGADDPLDRRVREPGGREPVVQDVVPHEHRRHRSVARHRLDPEALGHVLDVLPAQPERAHLHVEQDEAG